MNMEYLFRTASDEVIWVIMAVRATSIMHRNGVLRWHTVVTCWSCCDWLLHRIFNRRCQLQRGWDTGGVL